MSQTYINIVLSILSIALLAIAIGTITNRDKNDYE
jgi:hypothetical protein